MALIDKLDVITQDQEVMDFWDNVIPIIKNKISYSTHTFSMAEADRYKFDLYGLLRVELVLPEELIYPNILLNGYQCSEDYDGIRTTIYTGNRQDLLNYYEIYLSQRSYKK